MTATRWDNITILQAVDRHQERYGGGEVWGVDGRQLMDEVAGRQITEDALVRGFLQELEILEREGYLTFTIDDRSPNHRTAYPYQYLQQIRGFALTVKGQDRARGIRVVQPQITAAMQLVNRGEPVTVVRALLGHASLSSTQIYRARCRSPRPGGGSHPPSAAAAAEGRRRVAESTCCSGASAWAPRL